MNSHVLKIQSFPSVFFNLPRNFLFLSCTTTSNERLFSGATAAVVSGALIFTFLEPLFSIVGIELAMVALYILVVAGSLVGLSLGVFLPTLFPGACAGVTLTAFVASFLSSSSLFFAIVAPALACIGAGVSVK